MAFPKIGLEALFEDKKFRDGAKRYLTAQDEMEKANKDMKTSMDKSGKSIDDLGDDMKEGGKSALDLAAQMVVVKMAMNTIKELAGKGLELAKLGATAERVEERFEAFAEEAGGATAMLEAFQKGAGGAASEMDAMLASSKLLQMGLVTNAEEMETTVELATRLGDQTASVTSRVEDFALMLANQSIPRLDNFGISSGQVRARITELMGSVEGMTRETAFMQATMEAGGESLDILGERTKDTAMTFEIMEARMADAKVEMGKKFAPVAGAVFEVLGGLSDEVLMVGAAFGEFGGALVQAGPLLNAMMPSLKGLLPVFQKLPGAIKAMNLGLNASTLALGGVLAAIPLIIIGAGKLKGAIDDYNEGMAEASRLAREWDTAIHEQLETGKKLEGIIRVRIKQIKEERIALEARSGIEKFYYNEILVQANVARRRLVHESEALTRSLVAEGLGFAEANRQAAIWNKGMIGGIAIIPKFTAETYNAAAQILAIDQYTADFTGTLWDLLEAMTQGELDTYDLAKETREWTEDLYNLSQEVWDQADAVASVDDKMFAYARSMKDGTILTDENAIAQANLVYELGLQAQAREDAKQAQEDATQAAEEAARVQEELAIAHQKVIDTIIIEQQQYLTLAERMKGIDEAGQMRMMLDEINRLQREGIDIGEPYWQAQQRIQDQMGVTTPKSRFMAEGFHMITEAAEEGRLGNWTYSGAMEALFGSWDKGAKNALTWAESIGLAPPLTEAATGAVKLYGEAADGVSQPSLDAASSAGMFGTKADELYKAVVPVTEGIDDFTRKNIEAEEPIQRTEQATRLLQKEMRGTLDPTGAMTGAVELYGEAGDRAEDPIKRTEQATRILQKELRGTLDPTDAMTGAVELYGEAGDFSAEPVGILTEKTKRLATATGESVQPLGDAAEAVDDFAESTLEAQDPVDELLARFELLPDQILTLAPEMRQAGVSLVGAFRVGFEKAFEALEEEKVRRLEIFRREFHSSREPKDPTSPLRGFFEAGAALVQTYMEGLESEWPNLGRTLDDMFQFGRAFGGLGGIAGGILGKDIRGMKEATKGIDAELMTIYKRLGGEGRLRGGAELSRGIADLLGGEEALRFLEVRQQMGKELTEEQKKALDTYRTVVGFMRERHELTEEQIRLQEKLTRLEEAQTRLRFLEQQVTLLKMIEEHGLDAQDILQGLALGAEASAEEVLDAMVRAMDEVVHQAEERLGIESPSKVFFKIGQETMAGMAMGIQDLATLPVRQSVIASRAVASAPALTGGGGYVDNSRSITIQAGGNTISSGMDASQFDTRVRRAVRRGMTGL